MARLRRGQLRIAGRLDASFAADLFFGDIPTGSAPADVELAVVPDL